MDIKNLICNFAEAIYNRKLVQLQFRSKDSQVLVRKCVPLDLAPSRKGIIKLFKFHFWDLDSKSPHVLSIEPNQIIELNVTEEHFQPEQIVTWNTSTSPWCLKRDWGIKS